MGLPGAQYCCQNWGLFIDQQKKRCRDKVLSLYCGSWTDWASQCPHKRSRRKPSPAATTTSEGGGLIPTPAIPVLFSASVIPAQVIYEAKNYVPLWIALIYWSPWCHLEVLKLFSFMILFIHFVSVLFVAGLMFLLLPLLRLCLVSWLSVLYRNPLCLLQLFGSF